jgi:hypothetical protein
MADHKMQITKLHRANHAVSDTPRQAI